MNIYDFGMNQMIWGWKNDFPNTLENPMTISPLLSTIDAIELIHSSGTLQSASVVTMISPVADWIAFSKAYFFGVISLLLVSILMWCMKVLFFAASSKILPVLSVEQSLEKIINSLHFQL